jgi:hypothetical protein
MKGAKIVKRDLPGFRGIAHLWELDEPVEYGWDYEEGEEKNTTRFVVTSAVDVPMLFGIGGDETYIFPADAEGNVLDWGELPGSYRGGSDHERAIRVLLERTTR